MKCIKQLEFLLVNSWIVTCAHFHLKSFTCANSSITFGSPVLKTISYINTLQARSAVKISYYIKMCSWNDLLTIKLNVFNKYKQIFWFIYKFISVNWKISFAKLINNNLQSAYNSLPEYIEIPIQIKFNIFSFIAMNNKDILHVLELWSELNFTPCTPFYFLIWIYLI